MFKIKLTVLYLFFLGIILVVCFKAFGQKQKPQEPKYRYFLRHETEIGDYVPSIDTVNMIIGEMGRTMSVDESRLYQMTLRRNIQKLIGKVTRDSVLIK